MDNTSIFISICIISNISHAISNISTYITYCVTNTIDGIASAIYNPTNTSSYIIYNISCRISRRIHGVFSIIT